MSSVLLAQPILRTPAAGNTGKRTGVDVMVALDVSNSMLAQDVKPNRLERAKQVLGKMIDKMGNNRHGNGGFCRTGFFANAFDNRSRCG